MFIVSFEINFSVFLKYFFNTSGFDLPAETRGAEFMGDLAFFCVNASLRLRLYFVSIYNIGTLWNNFSTFFKKL